MLLNVQGFTGADLTGSYLPVRDTALYVRAGDMDAREPEQDCEEVLTREQALWEVLAQERQAATHIQARWRGHFQRKVLRRQYLRQHQAAVMIQTAWRGYRLRCTLVKRQQAAVKIQAVFRGVKARQVYAAQREATVRLQAAFRGLAVRKRMAAQRGAVVRVQAAWRRAQLRRQVAQTQAAVRLQAAYRAFAQRRQHAAARVQSAYFRQTLVYRVPEVCFEASHSSSHSLALGTNIRLGTYAARHPLLPPEVIDSLVGANSRPGGMWSPEEKLLAMESVPRKRSSPSW